MFNKLSIQIYKSQEQFRYQFINNSNIVFSSFLIFLFNFFIFNKKKEIKKKLKWKMKINIKKSNNKKIY